MARRSPLTSAAPAPAFTVPSTPLSSVTRSACYYVVRCLVGEDVPVNAGCFAPVQVDAPPGCLVNARPPAAVARRQCRDLPAYYRRRIWRRWPRPYPDRVAAAGQGTMNNCTMGGEKRRRLALDLLRNTRRRYGRAPARGRPSAAAHVHMSKHAQHTGRGSRNGLPASPDPLSPASRQRRRRNASRRRRHRTRIRDPAADNGHHPQRTPCHCPLGPGRRGHRPRPAAISSSIPTAPKKSSPPKSPAACSPASACASKHPAAAAGEC